MKVRMVLQMYEISAIYIEGECFLNLNSSPQVQIITKM